ncbi:hypothetical protein H0O02_01055 [Candidatus Micrarchaeota archaeon]|nr:hypothetical protein [Candidatus Micrarchaeota archaeon]
MKPVVVVTDDRPGLLGDISYILSKSGIAIDGVDVDLIGSKTILSISVRDPKKAKGVLENNGYSAMELDAIVIKVTDRLKSFAEILRMLEKKKVHVEDYSEITSDDNNGIFALTVNKKRKASRLLGDFMVGSIPG